MNITILIENTSSRGLPAEHGLSLFVESGGLRFLFDMGQSAQFAKNAETLGIDLSAVDFAVLSHGHYDHGGGIETFLKINDHAPVYVSRFAFEPHYNGTGKYIGLDARLRDFDRLVFLDTQAEIAKDMTLYPPSSVPMDKASASSGLYMMRHGAMAEEDFRHEQYLAVQEDGNHILFSGCSHRGILNIMRRFQPDILIGGFHFFKLPADDTLAAYAKELDAYPADYYTCHCTGTEQYEFMKRYMKRLKYLGTGDSVTV